jgi:outer membrane protein OmpA-like peptidoglycan-associated protein
MKNKYSYVAGLMLATSSITIAQQNVVNDIKEVKVTAACFNSEFDDYGPQMVGGKLHFISSRSSAKRKFHDQHSDNNAELFHEIYEVDSCKAISHQLNTRFNDGPIYESQNGKMLFVSRNIKGEKGVFKLGLFYTSKLPTGEWGEVIAMPFNNAKYSVMHPFYDESKGVLYFSTDMVGGVGGYDIYSSSKTADGWAFPKKVDIDINSSNNEGFPFIYDGYLYYSSNKEGGLGGMDIYRYDFLKKESRNMGEGINSTGDDLGICFVASGKGYLSSNRIGGLHNDDIFEFSFSKNIPVVKPTPVVFTIAVMDGKTALPIDSVTTSLAVVSKGITTTLQGFANKGLVSLPTFAVRKNDSAAFEITLAKKGYLTKSITIQRQWIASDTFNLNKFLLDLNISLEKLDLGENLAVLLKLNPIYFESKSAKVTALAAVELDKIVAVMVSNPTMVISLMSFCDSRGKDMDNMVLSEARAKSCAAYVIAKSKTEPARVTYKGYGETRLLNGCSNGVPCSDEEHAINRRTEFVILKM